MHAPTNPDLPDAAGGFERLVAGNYATAWFDDNIGDFLITVEQGRSF